MLLLLQILSWHGLETVKSLFWCARRTLVKQPPRLPPEIHRARELLLLDVLQRATKRDAAAARPRWLPDRHVTNLVQRLMTTFKTTTTGLISIELLFSSLVKNPSKNHKNHAPPKYRPAGQCKRLFYVEWESEIHIGICDDLPQGHNFSKHHLALQQIKPTINDISI